MGADAVGGLPSPNYGAGVSFQDPTLSSLAVPAINTEYDIPVLVRRCVGPSGAGYVLVQLSQNAVGCAKNVTVNVYANGVLAATSTQSLPDSSTGLTNTYAFPITPKRSSTTYRVTVSTPCPAAGNGTIFLGSKALVVIGA